MLTIRLFDNWAAAKMKIRVPKIAAWPATSPWGEREKLLGSGETWVSEGARLQSKLFRHRCDRGRSRRPRVSAAVGLDRNRSGSHRSGSLLDLINRHYPRSQKA